VIGAHDTLLYHIIRYHLGFDGVAVAGDDRGNGRHGRPDAFADLRVALRSPLPGP
jgi:hypothetical protein